MTTEKDAAPTVRLAAGFDEPAARRLVIFAVVSITILMSSIDQTIVATALHAIQHGLHASINWAGWTITAYSLGRVLVLPLAGSLSERYGRRRVFVASVILFTLASLFCGLANDIYVLVALRAVQAVGGAAFMPAATGIVVEHFGDARDRAIGMFTSIFPIGAIVGPILGGVFVEYWSWRGIFFVNVPIGIVLVGLCFKYVPRDPDRHVVIDSRLDVRGMVLLGVAVLTAMLGISYLGGGARVWSALFIAPEVAAAAAFALFVRHVGRAPAPFIAPRLLHGEGFGTLNLINFLYGAAAFGLGALVPLYATVRYGIGVLDSGTLLTARGIGVIAVAALAALALRRTGYRLPMFVGFIVIGVGLVGLAVDPIGLPPYAWLAIGAGLTGVGMGMVSPAANNASLQLAPDQAAAIAGLRGTCRQAGAIIAISVTTAVLARASDPGQAEAYIFVVFALMLLLTLPLVRLVPEHRGTW